MHHGRSSKADGGVLRVFAIYNPLKRKRRAAAWVLFEPGENSYRIELAQWAQPKDLPLELALYKQDGTLLVGGSRARRWVEDRVPPQDRDNIEQVLDAAGIDEYYLPSLLGKTKGRCWRDDFLLEEVPETNYRSFDLNKALSAPVALGTQISRARRAAGLTQAQLAQETGVQQAIISRIENGKGSPTLETLEILARGCGRGLRIDLE